MRHPILEFHKRLRGKLYVATLDREDIQWHAFVIKIKMYAAREHIVFLHTGIFINTKLIE